MIRLCKKIKHYQKWIEAVKQHKGKHDIATTSKINLHLVDNESFKKIILHSAQQLAMQLFTTKYELDTHLLYELLNKNIFNITIYANGNLKNVKKVWADKLNTKPGTVIKLLRIVRPFIRSAAQKIEFGELFNVLEKK
eukprot:471553_1